MKRKRQQLGLSQNQAALRAGVSVARYRQIEQGYEKRGPMKIPANPSADFVIKIARGLDMPRSEALQIAGHDPDMASPEATEDRPPTRLLANWPRLNGQQRAIIDDLVTLFADPDAVVRTPTDEPRSMGPQFKVADTTHLGFLPASGEPQGGDMPARRP
jgi:transcriptional regulator with XRE-family HTH domain